MAKYVYRWDGEYWGFIEGEYLFDKNGNYKGFLEGVEVHKEDGSYVGTLTEEKYILISTISHHRPLAALRPWPPKPTIPPEPPGESPRTSKPYGAEDALNRF